MHKWVCSPTFCFTGIFNWSILASDFFAEYFHVFFPRPPAFRPYCEASSFWLWFFMLWIARSSIWSSAPPTSNFLPVNSNFDPIFECFYLVSLQQPEAPFGEQIVGTIKISNFLISFLTLSFFILSFYIIFIKKTFQWCRKNDGTTLLDMNTYTEL